MTDPFPTATYVPFYKGRRVAVTGATGLIGSYVVKLLKESGAYVRAIFHHRPHNEFTALADDLKPADLMHPVEAANALWGCDTVMSCAGITGGIGIVKVDPISYVGPATVIMANTLHAAMEAKVERFGFLSSTTVYPATDQPVVEEDVEKGPPYKLYWGIGESKRFLEKLCRYYTEKTGIDTAIVRPSGAYGRFDNFDERTSHVVPGMINRALRSEKDTFEVWGDGGDTRDFIHAQDVAMGLLLATVMGSECGPFNIASGKGVTTMELAKTVLDATGSTAKIITDPSKPTALRTRLVDITKAKALLGFEPSISLEAGIRDTIAWRRSL